jgi:4-hydroxybenzoate polyprenyltransferase
MEIVELSGLPIDDLGRYLRTRVPVRIYLPLALFLTVAGQAGGRPPGLLGLVFLVGLAYVLVLGFRLWDDLIDRERDRFRHPDRALSQAGSVRVFRGFLIVAFAVATAMVASREGAASRLAVVAILCAALFVWYRVRRRFRAGGIANYHVVLLKYPVIVCVLGSPSSETGLSRLLMAMVLVYLCFCIYEVLHDADLRAAQGARAALALEMWALSATFALMAVTLFGQWRFAGLLQGTLALVGVLFLVRLFHLHRARPVSSRWSYAVFVIGFLQVLTFHLSGAS